MIASASALLFSCLPCNAHLAAELCSIRGEMFLEIHLSSTWDAATTGAAVDAEHARCTRLLGRTTGLATASKLILEGCIREQ